MSDFDKSLRQATSSSERPVEQNPLACLCHVYKAIDKVNGEGGLRAIPHLAIYNISATVLKQQRT